MRFLIIGSRSESGLVGGARVVEIPFGEQGIAQIKRRERVTWIGMKRGPEVRYSFFRLAVLYLPDAKSVQRLGIVRIEPERFDVFRFRVLRFALLF